MKNLTTNFAGLELKNPIIVSSSGLTDTAEKCHQLEESGAAAIILKSIFEEQILQEYDLLKDSDTPEGNNYLETYLHSHTLNKYIALIKEAKRQCHIPIIASINCTTHSKWAEYANIFEKAGADAIELNIMEVQTDLAYEFGSYEMMHVYLLNQVKKHTTLPVIMKLGSNLTNPAALINKLYANGTDAVVLFNRPYRPDINIDKMTFNAGEIWTRPSDICEALRWTGISSALTRNLDYAISGGVHDGWAVIKSILVGASAVEICTTLFWNGPQRIQAMLQQIKVWMKEHHYENIPSFKSQMNQNCLNGNNLYERTQFMKYFSNQQGNPTQ